MTLLLTIVAYWLIVENVKMFRTIQGSCTRLRALTTAVRNDQKGARFL